MGIAHSRIIYDPENRNLDLQDLAKEHHTRISEWKIDENGRMICTESIDILPGLIDNKFKELYSKLDELGLLGIHAKYIDDEENKEGTIYSFKEKW
jgi:hypothetical protein